MMDFETTLNALKHLKVETGSLACAGCGREHNCGIEGCAIIRQAVEHMECARSKVEVLDSYADQLERELKESEVVRMELGQRVAVLLQGKETLLKQRGRSRSER